MRLFLLPISTRRSLVYCERLHDQVGRRRSLLDRATTKANETWAAWEKDEAAVLNWKKRLTVYANVAFRRIPYEEWGLKTIPALTAARRKAAEDRSDSVHVVFPGRYLREASVPDVLRKLASERQALHRRRMLWSIAAMPLTAPFLVIPMCAARRRCACASADDAP